MEGDKNNNMDKERIKRERRESKEKIVQYAICLQDVKSWMISNKLKMNDSKTECIVIGSYQQLAKINLTSISVGKHRITVLDDI